VFPVILGYIIAYTCILTPLTLIFHNDTSFPLIAGIIVGYIAYDLMHYFLHFSSPKAGYLRYLKKYHMQHHYKNGQEGFGVSSTFWDHVFKTLIPNVTSN
jgi:4-hydroxysphinganine ceramide fatty acyl 2-hydroxylase